MRTNRRAFLKLAAMSAASAAGGWITLESLAEGPNAARGGVTWGKAPCRFCGVGCSMQVGVENGRVVAITGAPDAEVNRGFLCVKGYHVGMALYGKDRLTTPLLKKNGRLTPISWDEAIRVIANRIQMDPAGFAVYGSGQWTICEGYAVQKLMKAGLSNNHVDPNGRLCAASAVTGAFATYGADGTVGCYDDLDEANTVILWGNNPAEAHPVLFSRITDRRLHGDAVTLIEIGPRDTRTSAFAQVSLRCRPSSEHLVAKGVLGLLIKNETWDKDFVSKNCGFRAPGDPATVVGKPISFEEWKVALDPYDPDTVERLSGVTVKQLRMLADTFGRRDQRVTSLWSEGLNPHSWGTAMNSLVHSLHLFSGHIGKPGDAPMALAGQPSACGTVREVGTFSDALPGGLLIKNEQDRAKAEELWNVPPGRIRPEPGHHALLMWGAFSTPGEENGDIHTIWVQATNPAQTLPNRHRLFDPSRTDPDKFLIVSDVYPTATTLEADLVLPSTMWVEKNGMFGNAERRTQQWFKMVEPPGQARDDCWQTMAVAHELYRRGFEGMKDKDGRFLFDLANGRPIWDWAHFHDVNVDRLLFEEYRKFTALRQRDLAPYDEYVKTHGLRWPVAEQANGSWRETRRRFSEGEDPNVAAGKGFDFYGSTSGDGRAQIWFYPDQTPVETTDGDYPFWLGTGRVLEHWGSGTMTGRIPQLRNAMPHGYLEMNRQDAGRLAISDGETVIVESRRGEMRIPVWIDGRGTPPPGTLFVPFFDERLRVNELTPDAHDPLSKQPDFKACAVRVRRLVG